MKTTQPIWKTIANLGDVDPVTYGGYFVMIDTTGVYPPEAEILEPPTDDIDEDDPAARWTVRRFILEPCTYINGILSDNSFHPEMPAWFADDLGAVARSCGWQIEDLIAGFVSTDPILRANAWRDIGEYHGFDNLDSYPRTYTRAEIEARYSE